MPRRFSVTDQWRTATKHPVLCCACLGLSFFALLGLGLVQRTRASENVLPARQVSAAPTKIQPKLAANYGKLPLSFEANQGQTDARVRFLARGGGYTIFLTDGEAVLTLRKSPPGQLDMTQFGKFGLPGRFPPSGLFEPHAGPWPSLADDLNSPSLIPDLGRMVRDPNAGKGGVAGGTESQPPQVMRMRLVGGNAKGRVVGLNELPGRSNYFIGNDPKKWRTNVPSYARVKYVGVYPGVDLLYYGNQGQLEYDFVVAPGADPSVIALDVTAVSDRGSAAEIPPLQKRAHRDAPLQIAADGALVLKTDGGEVRFHKPVVYQTALNNGQRTTDHGPRTPVDGHYVLQANNRVGFKVPSYDHTRPLFIDPVLGYSSYLGGSGADEGRGIAVDATGNAYVTGKTTSTDFPTLNPFQANCASCSGLNYNVFVTKVNPAGSALVYSTYLGGSGSDEGHGIAVDAAGNAYVTGQTVSTNFPTVTPFQATNNATPTTGRSTAFVAKLSATGSSLIYSTYLGGNGGESGNGIAADSAGDAYVTGATSSTDFPTAEPFQATCDNCSVVSQDVFVAKLNPAGSALVYSTYLGGSADDEGEGIAVDAGGNAYVTGETVSTNFPTVNPIQANCDNCADLLYDAFVAKLNPAGSALVYSTYLGGSLVDEGTAIAVVPAGDAYVTGWTNSDDFPTAHPLQRTLRGTANAFVARLNPAGSALVYSTYLGGGNDAGSGIAADSAGNAYVTGGTQSKNFPTANAFQPTYGGGYANAFVTELNPTGSAFVYSSYLGGSYWDVGYGLATDGAGNAYVTGFTYSTDFPRVNQIPGACKGTCGAGGEASDAFVAKIAGAAAPVVSLSTNSLTFSSQTVNTTSVAQPVTLSNTGSAALSIASVVTSANFGETDDCDGSVASSGTCTINVTFTPTATGTLSGSLTITDNNDGVTGSTQTVTLSGTGTAPSVSLSTTSVTFSNEPVGTTSAPSAVTVTNNGTASLTFTSIAATGDFAVAASSTTCSTSTPLAASSNCVINVTFTPTATGSRSGSLTLTDNASGSPQIVSLTGTGTAPAVSLSPTSVSFGNQPVGTTSAASAVTVTNNGTASLTFTSIAATGDFAVAASGTTCSTSAPVAASSNCVINVTFTPAATGSRSGSLTLTDNASGSPQIVSLTGTGTAPGVSLSTTSISFSNQPVGTTSAASAVTVTNNGTASLTFTSIAATGDFAVTASGTTCSTSAPVAASASCVINVTFTPTASGSRSGSLTLTDNASGSAQTVSLSGTGTAPSVSLSTTSVSFGNQLVGTTSAASAVTVTNNGTASLTFLSLAATGDFAVAASGTTCSTSVPLAASSNCAISLTFTPTATGSRTGSLTLTDNASGSPQTVSLSGIGTGPNVSLSPASVSFTDQVEGTTSGASPVTVTNNGTASLSFTSIAATGDFAVAASGTTCSTSAPVAAGGSCVINVTFTPTATGSRSGSLTLTDNASGSPQTVGLSGTGTEPVVSLSPPLNFSPQLVKTTSNSQTVTLTNTGSANVTLTAIGATGPFAIATSGTTCSTSSPVAAAATCTVAVTFTPTAGGTASGSLSFSDNAPSSPQTVTLSGTGQDFSFVPPSGSSTSAPVAPGSPATYTLSVGGEGGLSGAVNFTCTGAPSEATCTVSPNPATAGSSATNVTVTVTTTAPSVGVPRSRPLPPAPPLSPGLKGLLMLALILAAMAWVIMRRSRPGVGRWQSAIVPLAFALMLTLALAGCAGGGAGGSTTTTNPGTPAGTYNLTVTGTSSTLSHSVTLTLTVS